jgi:DNA-binding PadR family transcriptional regulator
VTTVFKHGALRLYLLKLLDEQPRHGYEVISLLEDRFLGFYSPSAGTVYPRLARLEVDGLVEHEESNGRKVYRLTDAGRAELARQTEALHTLEEDLTRSVTELARDVRSQVHASVRDLRAELKQAAREVRRESRSSNRRNDDGDGDGVFAVLAEELERLRADVVARAHAADGSAVAAVVDVVRRARTEALEVLRGGATAGR